jgi:hypothetical protein
VLLTIAATGQSAAVDQVLKLTVQWDKGSVVSKTIPTLQVVVNSPLRPGTAIHDHTFKALHDLGADFGRLGPLAALSKTGCGRTRPACGRKNFMGLFPD